MSRKFIASILAASLAITSFSAVPAKAGNDDLGKFLAGATALAIIGAVIHDRNKRRDSTSVTPVHPPRPVTVPTEPRPRRHVLPQQCRSTVWTPQGRERFLDGRCLRRNYKFTHSLPRACKVQLGWANDRPLRGYRLRCLKDFGYRISQR